MAFEEARGRVLVPLFREEEIDGLARLIHRARERVPLACDPDGRLVQAPTDPDRLGAAVKRLLSLRTVFADPAVDGRVVNREP
jgi:hypothetical protein